MSRICIFASSSDKLEQIYYTEAVKLGNIIAESGHDIVYGGSRLGLMYACAGAVKANGGKIIGIMPDKLSKLGCSNPEDCDEFIITSGMRERKAKMDEYSDSVIALAGGFGTLEEISEIIVQKQLGYNDKPIVILNTNGFYNSLIDFFNQIILKKFAKNNSKNLYYIANTPEDAILYINNYSNNKQELSSKY